MLESLEKPTARKVEPMLKIGPFSRIAQVPVSLLRYYADIDLLKPSQIDPFTGYRYYELSQLPTLNRVLALRDLGLSLDQIKVMVSEGVSADELRAMLRLQQARAAQELQDAELRLNQVARRLAHIEREGRMSEYDVVIKSAPAIKIASVHLIVPTLAQMSSTYDRVFGLLMTWLSTQQIPVVGPPFAMYGQDEFTDVNIDVEICFPIPDSTRDSELVQDGETLRVYSLPEAPILLSTMHQGSYDGVSEAYQAVLGHASQNNYHIVGPSREIYLSMPTDPVVLTEVQYPVIKR
jgi:DNA-binding transcriptional MerR regulator